MKSQRNKSQRSQFLVFTCKNLLEIIYLTSAKKNDLPVVTFIKMSILFKKYFMLAYFACCLKYSEISFCIGCSKHTLIKHFQSFVGLCS